MSRGFVYTVHDTEFRGVTGRHRRGVTGGHRGVTEGARDSHRGTQEDRHRGVTGGHRAQVSDTRLSHSADPSGCREARRDPEDLVRFSKVGIF